MIIVILALCLILFSIIDRYLFLKFYGKEKLKSVAVIVIVERVIFFTCYLIMIYYITDTFLDFFIVVLTFSLYFALVLIYNMQFDKLRWNLVVMLGTPLFAILLIFSIQHLLIEMHYMLLPVLIPATIIVSSYK
ncbi:hypothetical protein [Vallitalea okinawensis]|uniref:hypothetical protein n=1 Tax=Vallitalea okinawensis TaxID=2078660 RepID=UPI000CFB94FC|nr:hypothetical protein [Vallitalea okinawensis]